MPSSVSRGPITTHLYNELHTANFPVGDNSSPEGEYGWNGEPGEGTFTPWMILTPLTGTPQRVSGAMGDSSTEWVLPYSVFYAGVTRKQSEALADKMREHLTNITRISIATPTGAWRIQKISSTNIGSSIRVGSAYPDYYTQTDNFEVWTSKEN